VPPQPGEPRQVEPIGLQIQPSPSGVDTNAHSSPAGQTPFVQVPVSPKATLHGMPTKSQVHPALRLTRQALPDGQAPSHAGKVALPQGVLPATHSQPFAVTAQIGASGGHSPQQSGGGALPGSPHGIGTNVVVVIVLVVVVVVGTQTVLSAAQAARTCCTHCWLHFVLAFPLEFLQPAAAWHASISSSQFFRRHGGEVATAEVVSPAATARSTHLVGIFRAVIVPPDCSERWLLRVRLYCTWPSVNKLVRA